MRHDHGLFRTTLRLAIGLLLVVICARTLFVAGWLTPIVVQGSSMAPALLGSHVLAECNECGLQVAVGEDQQTGNSSYSCYRCRRGSIKLDESIRHQGDGLLIDRRISWLQSPQRWDVVVARNPENTNTLAVKRVVGRPGETVQFRGGDLWIDGKRLVKSLADQRRVRQLVEDGDAQRSHWRCTKGEWDANERSWSVAGNEIGNDNESSATLWYAPPSGKPVQDNLASNLSVSRRLNTVRDLMLVAWIDPTEDAIFSLTIKQSSETVSSRWDVGNRTVELTAVGRGEPLSQSATFEPGTLDTGKSRFTLSTFDRQAIVAVSDAVLISLPLQEEPLSGVQSQQIEIDVEAGAVTILQPQLFRDIYWEAQAIGTGAVPRQWVMGPNSWFLVGDNQAISRDSRNLAWGPHGVPRRLIFGRVIGPAAF